MKTYKIWDKQESINGIEAELVIESNRIHPDDEIFLIEDNGRVIAIETVSIIKSVYNLDSSLNAEQVAEEYLRINKEQEESKKEQIQSFDDYKKKVDELTAIVESVKQENADLAFQLMSKGEVQ